MSARTTRRISIHHAEHGRYWALSDDGQTVANVYSNAQDARLFAAAPKLYALAQQYLSECGECGGTGVCPDDEPCTECLFIRVILDEIDGKAVTP